MSKLQASVSLVIW